MKYSAYSSILAEALHQLDSWRLSYGEIEANSEVDNEAFKKIIHELTVRLQGNYPFHHPSYAGQMLKPPHPIAWVSYALASTINPNNHALDGGPPTSEMEKEVIVHLAEMIGYGNSYLGHLTSSGTTANLEALWVLSKQMDKEKKIAYSDNAHYTHERLTSVLGIPNVKIPTLSNGEWNWKFVQKHKAEIGAYVVTLGTTGRGLIEPLTKVLEIKNENSDVLIHIDAAYGGFFSLIADDIGKPEEYKQLQFADSIVIDPHKHGLQPYGCGSVLFKNPKVGVFYKHDSPYTYFSSDELHLGEISLECSRAGASAAAFWATVKYFPLNRTGLGSVLLPCRKAALDFAALVKKSTYLTLLEPPELDIVLYYPKGVEKASELSRLSKTVFSRGMSLPSNEGFHVSLFTLSAKVMKHFNPSLEADEQSVTVLRSVFMKPEQELFTAELIRRIENVVKELTATD